MYDMHVRIETLLTRSQKKQSLKPHYEVRKMTFPDANRSDFSILFTAISNWTFMGCACLYGKPGNVQLKLSVPKLYQGWGIEAHLLFHILKIMLEENIKCVSITVSVGEEDLINTLCALGFEIAESGESGAVHMRFNNHA